MVGFSACWHRRDMGVALAIGEIAAGIRWLEQAISRREKKGIAPSPTGIDCSCAKSISKLSLEPRNPRESSSAIRDIGGDHAHGSKAHYRLWTEFAKILDLIRTDIISADAK